MAKAIVPSLDAVPEALRPEYEKQTDGTFALKLEGTPAGFAPAATVADLNTKLAEFRENNRALNAKATDLENKMEALKGIDPAAYKAAQDELLLLRKKQPEGEAALGALRTQIETLGKQIETSNKQRDEAEQKAARKELENALTTAGIKAAVLEAAVPDFLARGLALFSIENGRPVAKQNGAPLFSKKNGTQPLSIEEWVGDQITDAPHLFKSSNGGNAGPAQGGNGSGGNGTVRVIPEGSRLNAQDISDIAAGKAIRFEAVSAA